MVERGQRTPSLEVLSDLQRALGLAPDLPAELIGVARRPIADHIVALLGAALACMSEPSLDVLAAGADISRDEVRQGLRALSDKLTPLGMVVIDDGATARLAPRPELQDELQLIGEPEQLRPMTTAQAEVLAICVGLGVATRGRIEAVRGVDSADIIATLVRQGLLACEEDDNSPGHPLVYRPTAKMLHVSSVETLEDLRVAMGVSPHGIHAETFRPE